MLFNSIEFLIFLPIGFIVYWTINKKFKLQNLFILIASYVFYGWWDWRFLILIAFTSICSYLSGIFIEKFEGQRKKQKFISATNIIINLIILCIFKYFNFFANNLIVLFELLGIKLDSFTLNVLLPVGISFYTFQALSYTIDIYTKKLKATRDFIAFFAYISFFPQLVAGPIERAKNLLPQFYGPRVFDYNKAVDGMRQILWGLFKKMVVADNCAVAVNTIFSNYTEMGSINLIIGAVLFAFQIYCDFSGYSDIAIGTARLFGIQLMQNFNFPYFSRDIAEFWRRWHISLSTWFRDYVYIPLGGSKEGKWKGFRNTMAIFLISGFWHGANWTFIIWGAYHALLFLPLQLLGKNRKNTDTVAEGRKFPNIKEFFQIILTFTFVLIGWVIFRAESIGQAIDYFYCILHNSALTSGIFGHLRLCIPAIFVLLIVEWLQRDKKHGLEILPNRFFKHKFVRFAIYYILVLWILLFMGKSQVFIYFQF